jgi:4-hydroxy-tetrahydrodipicolinate reductase
MGDNRDSSYDSRYFGTVPLAHVKGPAGELGMHAVRGGSWVGDHEVLLGGEGEWVELRHVAQDRSAFATGALAAARFVAQVPPGRYTLEDLASETGRVS